MGSIVLYHGSANRIMTPAFKEESKHQDYGRGFYLTGELDLAKEWAACNPTDSDSYVHEYELDIDDLRILDFQEHGILCWLAELMKHRPASDSKRYRMLAGRFIEKYGIDTSGYDVIKGWRADASYFFIAKEFVRDNVDVDILEELLSLGGLGIQYCLESEKAFQHLRERRDHLMVVDYNTYNAKYNSRDVGARMKMHEMIESEANTVRRVFSTLIEV